MFNIPPLFHQILFLTVFIHAFSNFFLHKRHSFSYLEFAYVQNMSESQQKIGVEKKKKEKRKNGQKDLLGWFM